MILTDSLVEPAPHQSSPSFSPSVTPSTFHSRLEALSQILSSIVTLIPSGLPSRILTCTVSKGHWRCSFHFSFSGYVTLRVLDKAEYSAFEST